MLEVTVLDYSLERLEDMQNYPHMQNWPVTYIIYNDQEAYIGETLDAVERTRQHLAEPSHDMLNKICVITENTYNKSVILDLESFLIKYMGAEGTYHLQNGNAGVQDYDYYQRSLYYDDFQEVWNRLMERGIVRRTLSDIENSDLFKYSPYKALNSEQEQALAAILRSIRTNRNPGIHSVTLVEGCAGTGKTVLAVFLIKLLTEITKGPVVWDNTDDIGYVAELKEFRKAFQNRPFDIGFVVPMQSLRETLKRVFRSIQNLSEDMIINPKQLVGRKYDLIIVDEAHRLQRRKGIRNYKEFDTINAHFGLGHEGTELDWIIKSSERQILFYDPTQSIKPADIERSRFHSSCKEHQHTRLELFSQLRCKGGVDYIAYIKAVLNGEYVGGRSDFGDYDLRFYDDAAAMAADIKRLNQEFGLCRMVAGYGFEWRTNPKKNTADYDIEIGDFHAKWNVAQVDWVGSLTSIDEVGCIHTIQGYDLNYCGVIYGPEIGYDPDAGQIVTYKKRYWDLKGKEDQTDESLRDYIINIYATLMTRGIRGTFVYVCDPNLREYLRQYLA